MDKDNVIKFPIIKKYDMDVEPADRESISTLVFTCGHSTAHLLETGEVVCSVCLNRLVGVEWYMDEDSPENY